MKAPLGGLFLFFPFFDFLIFFVIFLFFCIFFLIFVFFVCRASPLCPVRNFRSPLEPDNGLCNTHDECACESSLSMSRLVPCHRK